MRLILIDANKRSEEYVLCDRKLVQHFGCVHFDQATVNLGPSGHIAYIPQLIGVLAERALLHLSNVFEASEEHVLVVMLLDVALLHKTLRINAGIFLIIVNILEIESERGDYLPSS